MNNDSFIDSDLMKVVGHRMLLRIEKAPEKTKGGIIITKNFQDDSTFLSCIGEVVKMGDACYKDKMFYGLDPWCKIGDWVLFPRHAGQRVSEKDVDYIFIEDCHVYGVFKQKPEGVQRR